MKRRTEKAVTRKSEQRVGGSVAGRRVKAGRQQVRRLQELESTKD